VSTHGRPVTAVSSQAPLAQILAALDRAINSDGPAITIVSDGTPAPDLIAPIDIALVVVTSGSTGKPRQVALTGEALLASARATHKFLDAKRGERWSLRLPLTHIAGAMVLVRSLELGTTPIVGEIATSHFESIVPTQLHRAVTLDGKLRQSLQSARAVLVGGAVLSDDLLVAAKELGINVITTYGMSETAGGCAYNNEPLQGVHIRINSESRIEISGPMLASGYLGSDGLLEQSDAFHDGWFTTSDLGEMTAKNQLHVLGRADNVIITGGLKVSLDEVERIIRSYPGVTDALCAATPDDEWGQRILVGVVADSPIGLAELRDLVGQQLGRFAAPRAIVRLEEIPMHGIGKPDREALSTMQTDEEM
jgi:O-succinylbenzoic acid--CoA ligase